MLLCLVKLSTLKSPVKISRTHSGEHSSSLSLSSSLGPLVGVTVLGCRCDFRPEAWWLPCSLTKAFSCRYESNNPLLTTARRCKDTATECLGPQTGSLMRALPKHLHTGQAGRSSDCFTQGNTGAERYSETIPAVRLQKSSVNSLEACHRLVRVQAACRHVQQLEICLIQLKCLYCNCRQAQVRRATLTCPVKLLDESGARAASKERHTWVRWTMLRHAQCIKSNGHPLERTPFNASRRLRQGP